MSDRYDELAREFANRHGGFNMWDIDALAAHFRPATPLAPESVRTALEGALDKQLPWRGNWFHPNEDTRKAILDALAGPVATLLAAERVRTLENIALTCDDLAHRAYYQSKTELGDAYDELSNKIRLIPLADSPAPSQNQEEPERAAPSAKVTALPWHVYRGMNFTLVAGEGYDELVEKSGYLGGYVCKMGDWNGTEHADREGAEANADFIVAAANSYRSAAQPSSPPSQEGRAERLQKIAEVLHWHRRIETPHNNLFECCACAWRPDKNNAKVYDWQHRLHVAEEVQAALATVAPADAKGKETTKNS